MGLAGLPVVALVVACRDTNSQQSGPLTTRDSAGVEIAEIHGDPWAAAVWATLDTTKVLRIEPNDARPETLFGSVHDAIRLNDGRIAVLDRRRYQLFVFAPDGLPLRTIGRRGQGPGEFQFPLRLLRAGDDSIGVADGAHVSIFPLAGGDPRRVRMPATDAGHTTQAFGVLSNGGYLTIVYEDVAAARAGRNATYVALGSANPDGTPGRMLGRHLSSEFTYRGGGRKGLEEAATLFWEDPAGAALASGYVWCLSTRFYCEVWSIPEGYVRSIRSTVLPRPVTDGDVEALTASWLHGLRKAADSAETKNAIAQAHRMERMPVLSGLRTDTRGRIWMRAYSVREDEPTVRWLVFEASGEVLGTVTSPTGLRVLDIGEDYMLGVESNEDDVQRIALYRYHVTR
jgi:hypothetical protein